MLTQCSTSVRAWCAGFPYADFYDPCERGIGVNNSQTPYDQWQWTIAINASADFEVQSGRLAFAVADLWTSS